MTYINSLCLSVTDGLQRPINQGPDSCAQPGIWAFIYLLGTGVTCGRGGGGDLGDSL
jgi:hypothetical protein